MHALREIPRIGIELKKGLFAIECVIIIFLKNGLSNVSKAVSHVCRCHRETGRCFIPGFSTLEYLKSLVPRYSVNRGFHLDLQGVSKHKALSLLG